DKNNDDQIERFHNVQFACFFTRKETILMLQKRYKHVSILFLFFDFRRWSAGNSSRRFCKRQKCPR
ncbi:hypothetical protein, partial [Barnesiella intestinihominis]|uniref:hypothetical protein n=1 Tax=Barnesiella intestinihominis TaxID=487174 RepID=UPI003FD75157